MNTEPIVSLREGEIAQLQLNRPAKRNALTREMLRLATEQLRSLRHDDTLRLLVLSAAGSTFCAGMDLEEMHQTATQSDRAQRWRDDAEAYRRLLWELFTFPTPTLALLQGPVYAGGVGLAVACDLAVGTERSDWSLPELRRGITAAIVTPLLIHRLGVGRASWMLLSGSTVSAAEAHQWGLLHRLIPVEDWDTQSRNVIEQFRGNAPCATRLTKRHILASVGVDLDRQLCDAAQLSAQSRGTEEAQEGLTAFLEKRDPRWSI